MNGRKKYPTRTNNTRDTQPLRPIKGLRKVSIERRPEHLQAGEYMELPLLRARGFAARTTTSMLPKAGTEFPVILRRGIITVWFANVEGKFQVRRYV